MATMPIERDWKVTPERVDEAVRRLVEACHPLQIIAFGSRARGDHRPDSDLDLAIILDGPEEAVDEHLPYTVLSGIRMSVDMIPVSRTKFDLHRPWLNSVFNYIDREGVILYDSQHPESSGTDALHAGPGRRDHAIVSAA